LAISDAVTKRLLQQGIDFDDIVILEKDSDGNILAVNFNFKQYARIVGETTSRIQARLKEFEEENVVVTVPLGLATKNVFLEHFGPEIPVSFVPVGSVKTRLETGLKQAGINMAIPPANRTYRCRETIPTSPSRETLGGVCSRDGAAKAAPSLFCLPDREGKTPPKRPEKTLPFTYSRQLAIHVKIRRIFDDGA
jgi:hypothetical protein